MCQVELQCAQKRERTRSTDDATFSFTPPSGFPHMKPTLFVALLLLLGTIQYLVSQVQSQPIFNYDAPHDPKHNVYPPIDRGYDSQKHDDYSGPRSNSPTHRWPQPLICQPLLLPTDFLPGGSCSNYKCVGWKDDHGSSYYGEKYDDDYFKKGSFFALCLNSNLNFLSGQSEVLQNSMRPQVFHP